MIRYSIEVPEIGRGTAMIQAYEFTADYQKPKDAVFLENAPNVFPGWKYSKEHKTLYFETQKNLEAYARHTATREAVHEVFTEYYRRFGSQIFANNERILDRLVRSDVLCCVTGIVEFCLSSEDGSSPFQWDDAENLTATVYGENQWRAIWEGDTLNFCRIDEDGDDTETVFSVTLEKVLEITEDPEYNAGEFMSTHDYKSIFAAFDHPAPENVLEEGEDPEAEEESAEIFEWWALDSRLWNWLKNAGEVVIDSDLKVWGRQTTGQGIACDSVIARVAREHGILYGQKNEWVNN